MTKEICENCGSEVEQDELNTVTVFSEDGCEEIRMVCNLCNKTKIWW